MWQQFWKRKAHGVRYQKTADDMAPDGLLRSVQNESPDVIGMVANMVDLLTHSAKMGMPQFLSDVRLWVTPGGWLPQVIEGLLGQGFQVIPIAFRVTCRGAAL